MLYRMVPLPSDEPVQFVGVYVLQWDDVTNGQIPAPSVGFVEVEEDDPDDEEYAPGLPEPEY